MNSSNHLPPNYGNHQLPPTGMMHPGHHPHPQMPPNPLPHPSQMNPGSAYPSPHSGYPTPQQQQHPPPQQMQMQRAPQHSSTPPPQYHAPGGGGSGTHLIGQSTTRNGKVYSLQVEQEPVRARMCGFGDKDRRPITPPPCIRLVIKDEATGADVKPEEVDSSFFVLTVDLWNGEGNAENNLVRSSGGNPNMSISAASQSAFPPPSETIYGTTQIPAKSMPYSIPGPGYNGMMVAGQPGMAHPGYYSQQQQQTYAYSAQPVLPPQSAAPQPGMFTRNLIGSLTVNAFKLNDLDDKPGFFFILQDLSVRTEGLFRLKMSFVDVGDPNGGLNRGNAPVLATVFSESFQVYSAKKFPGVIESTNLSKKFAQQGIKIPIRKDGGPKAFEEDADVVSDDEY